MRAIVEGSGLQVHRLTYLFASLFPAMLAVRLMRRDVGQNSGGSSPLDDARGDPERVEGSDPPAGPDNDWEMKVPVAPINTALTWMLSGEAAVSRRIPMPVGSSVMIVATKLNKIPNPKSQIPNPKSQVPNRNVAV
jgi:hypothetical protein